MKLRITKSEVQEIIREELLSEVLNVQTVEIHGREYTQGRWFFSQGGVWDQYWTQAGAATAEEWRKSLVASTDEYNELISSVKSALPASKATQPQLDVADSKSPLVVNDGRHLWAQKVKLGTPPGRLVLDGVTDFQWESHRDHSYRVDRLEGNGHPDIPLIAWTDLARMANALKDASEAGGGWITITDIWDFRNAVGYLLGVGTTGPLMTLVPEPQSEEFPAGLALMQAWKVLSFEMGRIGAGDRLTSAYWKELGDCYGTQTGGRWFGCDKAPPFVSASSEGPNNLPGESQRTAKYWTKEIITILRKLNKGGAHGPGVAFDLDVGPSIDGNRSWFTRWDEHRLIANQAWNQIAAESSAIVLSREASVQVTADAEAEREARARAREERWDALEDDIEMGDEIEDLEDFDADQDDYFNIPGTEDD